MNMGEITIPKVEIDEELLRKAKARTKEEKQIVVHIQVKVPEVPFAIRIWPNTFLLPREGTSPAKLLHAERISMAPQWTIIEKRNYRFTLVFEALSTVCQVFDLVEDIPSFDRFEYRSIQRNKSDVYHLTLTA